MRGRIISSLSGTVRKRSCGGVTVIRRVLTRLGSRGGGMCCATRGRSNLLGVVVLPGGGYGFRYSCYCSTNKHSNGRVSMRVLGRTVTCFFSPSEAADRELAVSILNNKRPLLS